jgi:hypothetical protein
MKKNETVTLIADIKAAYPDEWVLLGDPVWKITQIQAGILLYHSKDYLEVCYKGSELGANYNKRTVIYTGIPSQQNAQKWWRAISLTDKQKTT